MANETNIWNWVIGTLRLIVLKETPLNPEDQKVLHTLTSIYDEMQISHALPLKQQAKQNEHASILNIYLQRLNSTLANSRISTDFRNTLNGSELSQASILTYSRQLNEVADNRQWTPDTPERVKTTPQTPRGEAGYQALNGNKLGLPFENSGTRQQARTTARTIAESQGSDSELAELPLIRERTSPGFSLQTSTSRNTLWRQKIETPEHQFTKQMMLKKLGLENEITSTGISLLHAYVNPTSWLTMRTQKERIQNILNALGQTPPTDKELAKKIRDSFEKNETIEPNGTLALILRYLDPNPAADTLKMGELSVQEVADKLGVDVKTHPTSLELAQAFINAYITPTSFFHSHFTNRHHAPLLKNLKLSQCHSVKDCYEKIIYKVVNDNIAVEPQGTLHKLINALKYLVTSPEINRDVQMQEHFSPERQPS